MMRLVRVRKTLWVLLLCAVGSAVAACGGSGGSVITPDTCLGKGATAELAAPPFLAYPSSGSMNVATNIGLLIENGSQQPGLTAPITMSVSSSAGTIPVGAPTAAPSPLPSPFATAPPQYTGPYVAIPLPTLSPNTNYTVQYTYTGFADNPPSCTGPVTQTSGTFMTGS